MTSRSTAIFGGTFDPIHNGHLRSAVELREVLGVDELRLMPSHRPPLRDTPGASSEQRLAMTAAAIAGEAGLVLEDLELRRETPSYSAETLSEIRAGLGSEHSLIFIVGSDAFNQLHRWQNWRDIFERAHLLVLERPGYPLLPSPDVAAYLSQCWVDNAASLRTIPFGKVCRLQLSQLAISATDIRERIAAGRSVRYLLPDAVQAYIFDQRLYRRPLQETSL